MKILVCGGRDYNNWKEVKQSLDKLHFDYDGEVEIIEGGARGADYLAKMWAQEVVVPYKTFRADWGTYGKKAGYIRNHQMLQEGKPDIVVAFPGGKGTAMMVDIAKRAKVPVIKVKDD